MMKRCWHDYILTMQLRRPHRNLVPAVDIVETSGHGRDKEVIRLLGVKRPVNHTVALKCESHSSEV